MSAVRTAGSVSWAVVPGVSMIPGLMVTARIP